MNDEQIWVRVEELETKQKTVKQELTRSERKGDLDKTAELSKRFSDLKEILELANELRSILEDLKTANELSEGEESNEADEMVEKYRERRNEIAEKLFQSLLNAGIIDEEKEDERDIEILEYIHSLGPEYTLNLARNLNADIPEIRKRVEILLGKGLLTRVEGTMLENYHRQEGWDKHMNHTYYDLSREGKLYLRDLHRSEEVDR